MRLHILKVTKAEIRNGSFPWHDRLVMHTACHNEVSGTLAQTNRVAVYSVHCRLSRGFSLSLVHRVRRSCKPYHVEMQ